METSVSCKLMSDSEYSVIKSDVIKSFDCMGVNALYQVILNNM